MMRTCQGARAGQPAVAAAAQVERALVILGADVREHRAVAVALRCAHPWVSLEELGRLAEPPLSEDAVAGRIRRLLAWPPRGPTERDARHRVGGDPEDARGPSANVLTDALEVCESSQ